MISRQLVYKTLEFDNQNGRVPRDLWVLPWAEARYPEELQKIREDFPRDISAPDPCCRDKGISQGDAYKIGRFVDPWGCVFTNIMDGYHGEVKEAIVPIDDENWADTSRVHFPVEWLTADIDQVNAQCRASDMFMLSGVCPRPFEQLQFIRMSEQLFYDLADMPPGLESFMRKMHTFYCDAMELWAKTEVDALNFMDDWGSQTSLLINPDLWRRVFKPMYKDYIDIAHRAGKKIFMHSDGYTLSIIPDLIEIGLDALNTQIFCIGVENLKQFAGKITFWGEIDRQHMLPHGTREEVMAAVRSVWEALWQNGGAIAQCEFGSGGKPENIRAVFEAWNQAKL